MLDGAGEWVAPRNDLASPRRTEFECDERLFVSIDCFSEAAVRSKDRGSLSVEAESLPPPFKSSLSLSGSSSKST